MHSPPSLSCVQTCGHCWPAVTLALGAAHVQGRVAPRPCLAVTHCYDWIDGRRFLALRVSGYVFVWGSESREGVQTPGAGPFVFCFCWIARLGPGDRHCWRCFSSVLCTVSGRAVGRRCLWAWGGGPLLWNPQAPFPGGGSCCYVSGFVTLTLLSGILWTPVADVHW